MTELKTLEATLIGNMDAKVWAEEFVKMVNKKPSIATDEGTMITWFANAIMAGYDCAKKGCPEAKTEKLKTLNDLQNAAYMNSSGAVGVVIGRETIPVSELRMAAIKWAEDIYHTPQSQRLTGKEFNLVHECQGAYKFIKLFFNLTEAHFKKVITEKPDMTDWNNPKAGSVLLEGGEVDD